MKISACVPTYNRPDLVAESIQSILFQSHQPHEILIGDDSTNDKTKDLISSIRKQTDIPIRYWHHKKSLGQSRNVQFLFQRATGDVITLLHDDDLFLPDAFLVLVSPLLEHREIIASFGKQIIISENGTKDLATTSSINKFYNRTAENAGIIKNSLEAGAISMFPNNGYLIRKEIVQEIDYYDNNRAGKGCDFYFGLRVGLLNKPIFFCNEYTAAYRLTKVSSARSGTNSAYFAFKLTIKTIPPELHTERITHFLKSKVKVAIPQAALIDKAEAWSWFFSKWHLPSILTLGGIRRFLLLLYYSLAKKA